MDNALYHASKYMGGIQMNAHKMRMVAHDAVVRKHTELFTKINTEIVERAKKGEFTYLINRREFAQNKVLLVKLISYYEALGFKIQWFRGHLGLSWYS